MSSPLPAELTGLVTPGDGRGTNLGFPTANLKLAKDHPHLCAGIYACFAQILPATKKYHATLHIGPRPTFSGASPSVEVYLIDFPYQKLYGKKLYLSKFKFIRSIKKFNSSQDLVQAIKQDVTKAKQILFTDDQTETN